jgi:hypothetical protein
MLVLLDEQLPWRLGRALVEHEVRTVQRQGWSGIKNGELLRLASEAGFELLITADQNMPFQQNLQRFSLAVIVLIAPSNKIEDLLPLVPSILQTIPNSRPGLVQRVSG